MFVSLPVSLAEKQIANTLKRSSLRRRVNQFGQKKFIKSTLGAVSKLFNAVIDV